MKGELNMTKRKGIAFLAMLAMVFGLVFPKAAMTSKALVSNLFLSIEVDDGVTKMTVA